MPSLLYTEEEVGIVRSEGKNIPAGTENRQRDWSKVLAKHPQLFWIGDTGVRRKARALLSRRHPCSWRPWLVWINPVGSTPSIKRR